MTLGNPRVALLGLAFTALTACDPIGANINDNGQNGNTNTNYNYNYNSTDGGPAVDADISGFVRVQGTIWSPGADDPNTLEVNRFPIPGAVIIAYAAPPDDLPQGRYCNECVEIPGGLPNAVGDEVDGSFEILLAPGRTYSLAIQKGEFRRVRDFQVPDTPGEVYVIDSPLNQPRPEILTLPNRTNLAIGDNIPKIAIVDANYEDMDMMFEALGFDYTGEFDIYSDPSQLLGSSVTLDQYNLIVVPCGENWPYGSNYADNLRNWVKEGGKLYVDDFNYDFVEMVWPDFLVWYDGSGSCGTSSNPSDGSGVCNNWSSYDFNGDPGDQDFADWLALPTVNPTGDIWLEAAWDYLYEMGEGIVGIDPECMGNCGPNGEVYMEPKVWMYNADSVPFGATDPPATVSWPYYCGKVLYTVYHTHSGWEEPYELLLQEKIMMYLIMEIQTCSTGPIVR